MTQLHEIRYCIILACLMPFGLTAWAVEAPPYEKLLAGKDVRPGLVVVLPCKDAPSAVGLFGIATGIVHGLTLDVATLDTARRELLSRKAYGRVSLDLLPKGTLPYATAIVNAVIVNDPGALASHGIGWSEILRVTAPYGVIFVRSVDPKSIQAAFPGRTITPVVGAANWCQASIPYPPEMDEWTQLGYDASGTAQSHDQIAGPPTMVRWVNGPFWGGFTFQSCVSAKGRVFFRDVAVPFCWNPTGATLTAYDAFNGYRLWAREITTATCEPIAAGDRVYTVLPDSSKLAALNAATGETVLRYEFTPTGDLRLHRGIFLNKAGIEAWDAATGRALWKNTQPVQPAPHGIVSANEAQLPFAVEDDRIFCVVGDELVCNDLGTGQRKWAAPLQSKGKTEGLACINQGVILTLENPNPKGNDSFWAIGTGRILRSYSAADGKFLWKKSIPGGWVHNLLAFYGSTELAVFTGDHYVEGAKGNPGEQAKGSRTVMLDTLTGKEQRSLSTVLRTDGGCMPHSQLARWLMSSGKSGVTMISPDNNQFFSGTVVRFICGHGITIANGLFYQGVDQCRCMTCLRGCAAFASEPLPTPTAMNDAQRLVKGSAFDHPLTDVKSSPDDWPIFRHDALRRNATPAELPAQLSIRWQSVLPVVPSGATVVGKQVFCALTEAHAVCALDTATGKQQWLFATAARVDSPPTFHRGRVVFGSRDGWLYCLDAATGELAWRYFLAPADRRILVRGQLESNWPLFGSPVINEVGTVFVSAGRHSESGGGIYCAAIDLATGKPSWQSRIGPFSVTTDPAKMPDWTTAWLIENNDLLVFDNNQLLLPHNQINPVTGKVAKRTRLQPPACDELFPGLLGLFCEGNLTTVWTGQDHMQTRCRGHLARAWCLNEKNQWALSRTGDSFAKNDPTVSNMEDSLPAGTSMKTAITTPPDFFVSGWVNGARWVQKLPHEAEAKAILLAGSTIYISAVIDDPAGAKGMLYRFDSITGAPRDAVALPSPPVYEGLSAGQHCLFVATRTGLCCLGQ